MRYLKSYLPAHSILRGFVALHLCDFADAIRAGCAEAKVKNPKLQLVFALDAIRTGCAEAKDAILTLSFVHRIDAIRAGCAEAKWWAVPFQAVGNGCNPCGMC